jgi:hypothetical protein
MAQDKRVMTGSNVRTPSLLVPRFAFQKIVDPQPFRYCRFKDSSPQHIADAAGNLIGQIRVVSLLDCIAAPAVIVTELHGLQAAPDLKSHQPQPSTRQKTVGHLLKKIPLSRVPPERARGAGGIPVSLVQPLEVPDETANILGPLARPHRAATRVFILAPASSQVVAAAFG